MPCRLLLDQVAIAFAGGDVRELRALYDVNALICTAADRDTVLTPGELFERRDQLKRTYVIGPFDQIPIDETAGILRAIARIANNDGQYRPAAECFWLLTFTDGLIYRQRVLGSRNEANELYAKHGHELGLDRQHLAHTTHA